jgi:hypothetical protein
MPLSPLSCQAVEVLTFPAAVQTEPMEIAVRVLDAFCACARPRIEDVIALRQMARSRKEELMRPSDLACLVINRERKNLERHEIEQVLARAAESAVQQFRVASAACDEISTDIPSSTPQPDQSSPIRQAAAEKRQALAAMNNAVKRHHEFVVHGRLPDDGSGK